MASPWKQEFKDFKPLPPPWLSTGRKATPGVDYYDPRKPYKYWNEKEIRNHDEELQKIIMNRNFVHSYLGFKLIGRAPGR